MVLYLGLDGGGTGCRAAICDHAGQLLGRGEGGPANINSDLQGATVSILAAATAAMVQAGATPADLVACAEAGAGGRQDRAGDKVRALPLLRPPHGTAAMGRLAPALPQAGAQQIQRVLHDLLVERMQLRLTLQIGPQRTGQAAQQLVPVDRQTGHALGDHQQHAHQQ